MIARSFALALVGLLGWCSDAGTPPQKVEGAAAVPAVAPAAPANASATYRAPAGAIYGFDPKCAKCARTRGDGCVSTHPEGRPLGCGWVAEDGKRAAVAWVDRSAAVPQTLWWYGADGKTKAFWTPCEDPQCDATVTFEPGGLARVSYQAGGEARTARYDVDASAVVPP